MSTLRLQKHTISDTQKQFALEQIKLQKLFSALNATRELQLEFSSNKIIQNKI
jgi:hypothetical protein